MANRIPYGYRIVQARAVADPVESERLKEYFRLYLEGETMAKAAREAKLMMSHGALASLFSRKEYVGDGYYPPIISHEYQQRLQAEYQSRKRVLPGGPYGKEVKTTPVCTQFSFVSERQFGPDDPADRAAALFESIHSVLDISSDT